MELRDYQRKQLVSEDKVVHFADRCTKVVPDNEPEDRQGTWNCVDPCALLIMLQAGVTVGHGDDCVSPDEIKRTLDAHGWLTPEGLTDVVQADENYEKWSKQ